MRALAKGRADPARPHNSLFRCLAAASALCREVTNFALSNLPARYSFIGWTIQSPSFGTCLLLTANTLILLILGFYKLDPADYDDYQNIAYRWGFLTLGQVPLVFLLAGKESLIGLFTGHSYERLNWLHRWVARCMFLTATLHMGFWFGNWAPYDYIGYQIKNDHKFTQTGFAAWCILLWVMLSSVAPIRGLSHELFILQHFISFTAFMTMIFIHTPPSDHAWLWVPVALFFFDRLLRWGWLAYNNLRIFHPNRQPQEESYLTCHADLTPLPGQMTRLSIRNPPMHWSPGQHVHLSLHSISPLQSHPFTIASIPSDGKMDFIIKARKGSTLRYNKIAKILLGLPVDSRMTSRTTVPCMISNSYGSMRSLRQFDSVVLMAGSTGATFAVPLLRDIVEQWRLSARPEMFSKRSLLSQSGAVTRRVRFVWVVKSGECMSWFASQLRQALVDVRMLCENGIDVRLKMSIYVTCDDSFTSDWGFAGPDSSRQNGAHPPRGMNPVTQTEGSESRLSQDKTAKSKFDQRETVREVDPRSDSTSSSTISPTKAKACRPDGTCCCQTTVTDEKSAPSFTCKCNCSGHADTATPDSNPTSFVAEDSNPVRALAKENVAVVSGRPHPKTIIRRTLEVARGESAVVVCGPHSLNNDVRRSVVQLSDERAAGRSTGAQGVYFWGEGFGY
ncbi:MAG: hypothetical protein Q9162_001215 [Coniocarpon cinnabarinum]